MSRIFATVAKFPTGNEILGVAKFSLLWRNFAAVAKFPCFLLVQFLHSWLDAIEDKSYALDVN